jgi:molybdate transport system substrate-binding protein
VKPLSRTIQAVWLLLACAAGACRPAPEPGGTARVELRVAAAADLNVAIDELSARFSATHPIAVSASYGSSGTFFSQLLNGAPFDVFLSADVDYPHRLVERQLTDGGEFRYAIGRLVAWTSHDALLAGDRFDLASLADRGIARVAIANPEHAPYGRAAVAALRSAGVYEAVQPKLVYGENVAQALQFAQSGAADVGVVAMSLVGSPNLDGSGRWREVPAASYPRLEQAGVILRAARNAGAARAFRDYLLGRDGRDVLKRHGFALPEP